MTWYRWSAGRLRSRSRAQVMKTGGRGLMRLVPCFFAAETTRPGGIGEVGTGGPRGGFGVGGGTGYTPLMDGVI
jgi:hypothetical protein